MFDLNSNEILQNTSRKLSAVVVFLGKALNECIYCTAVHCTICIDSDAFSIFTEIRRNAMHKFFGIV